MGHPLAGLTRKNLARELLAGVTLLAISVPLNIGYAQIAGLPVTAGLYALILPSLVFALVSSTRQVVVAPDAAAAALVASSLTGLIAVDAGGYAAMAAAQALLGGLLFLLASRFRLGFIANFLSTPILVGFVAGLATDILSSQLAKMLGLSIDSGAEFLKKLTEIASSLGEINLAAVLLSAACLGALLLGKKLNSKIPWALLTLVLATAFSILFRLPELGVAVLGNVPAGPPVFAFPQLDIGQWVQLIPAAVALTAITLAEGLMISRSYAERNGYTTNPDRDLAAFGLANLAAGVSSSFTVGASTSRTAAMNEAGSRTQLPSVVLAIGAFLLLLFGTSLLADIPAPAIGAIVAVAVIRLLGIGEFRSILQRSRAEFGIALVCGAAVLLAGPINGLLLAFVLSLINLVRRAARPSAVVLADPGDPEHSLLEIAPGQHTAPGIVVLRLSAPIFFANAATFSSRLTELLTAEEPPKAVVLDLEGVSDIDVTGADALGRALAQLADNGVLISMTRVRTDLAELMTKLGVELPARQYPTNRAALHELQQELFIDPTS